MKHITIDDVRKMTNTDGLVLQGCGGDPSDWLKGINEMLTEAGVLKNGGVFENISIFEHNDLTNIIFPFDDVGPDTLDMGKFAIWRLQTREQFGGMWLSDYLPNHLGVGSDEPQYDDDSVGQGLVTTGMITEDSLTPTEDSLPSQAPSMIRLYIENTHDSNLGGFTIPMPTTLEKLQPFLDGIEISGWQDMRIWELQTEISGLGDVMYDYVSKAMTPELFDELNYLAAKLNEKAGFTEGYAHTEAHYAHTEAHTEDYQNKIPYSEFKEYLEAVIDSGRNCGSVAEIINLVTDNLYAFDVMPAFEPSILGEVYLDMDIEEHYEAFEMLQKSDDPRFTALAKYIEKLEKYVDHEAYGRAIIKEDDGVFTNQGYLTWQGDVFETPYQGPQDIPAEFRVFTSPDEITRPLLKVDDVGMAETLVMLHTFCNDSLYVADSLKTLITEGCNDYIISTGSFGVRIFDAMDAYKIGSDAFKVFTADASSKIDGTDGDSKFGEKPNRVFAISIHNIVDSDFINTDLMNNSNSGLMNKDIHTLKGRFVEINAKALAGSINRHAVAPNLMNTILADGTHKSYDLLTWAELSRQERDALQSQTLSYPEEGFRQAQFRFSVLRDDNSATCKDTDITELLSSLNTSFMAKAHNQFMGRACNQQSDMLRITNIAAKEILARGDVDIYRLTSSGPEKLSFAEALKAENFASGNEFAIKTGDIGNLDKWARSTAKDIVRKIELSGRAEKKKSHNEEL